MSNVFLSSFVLRFLQYLEMYLTICFFSFGLNFLSVSNAIVIRFLFAVLTSKVEYPLVRLINDELRNSVVSSSVASRYSSSIPLNIFFNFDRL